MNHTGKYNIIKNKNEIHVFGFDQHFDDEDIKSLWDEHSIFYQCGGVVALWVENRTNMNPLIHLMGEDDGHLFWSKEKDKSFDSHWLDNYIQVFTEMKSKLNNRDIER